jgi:preprotein translocase subunit SecE
VEIMAKTSPTKFAQEVRSEAKKITWPSRKETFVSTGMVFVMVFLAAIFFFLVDQLLSMAVKAIFN